MQSAKFSKFTPYIILLMCCSIIFSPLSSQSQKEVANWKTWVVNDFKVLDGKPIPGDEETQKELEQIQKLQCF